MSTAISTASVKQRWASVLEACCERMKTLAASLPEQLDDLATAEEAVRVGMLEIGRDLLQGWSDAADAKAAVPQCEACQEAMRHKGYVRGLLVTTLGNVHVARVRFRCEYCGREIYPQDARLRFRGHSVSWPLAKVVGRLGAQLPFEQARQNLLDDYRVALSKQTIELVCEHAGGALLDEEDAERAHLQSLPVAERSLALPDSEISPAKAYVFADGTMIHTAGDWHEIRVASVVSTNATDRRLSVDHRARFLSCEDFGWQLLVMARRAGYHRSQQRAFIADGARWLWDIAATHFPDAIQILDWYHLSEHVHATAAALYGESTEEAEAFSSARLDELWNGRAGETIAALKELRKTLRSTSKRESLRQLVTYLTNNRQRIDYPRYRAFGLTIGSGQVESTCNTLVGTRCKRPGMRNWTHRGAEGVLRLRSALQTGTYDQHWHPPKKAAA